MNLIGSFGKDIGAFEPFIMIQQWERLYVLFVVYNVHTSIRVAIANGTDHSLTATYMAHTVQVLGLMIYILNTCKKILNVDD